VTPPAYVTLTMDGLVARFGTTGRERWGCCFLWLLTAVWLGIMVVAAAHGGLGLSLGALCMMVMAVFLGLLSVGMLVTAFDRHELRLTRDGLSLLRTRWGRPRRVDIALRGLTVESSTHLAGKGYSTVHLTLVAADGQRHVVSLPGGQYHRDYERVQHEAAWMEATLRQAAEAATAVPVDEGAEAAARAALRAVTSHAQV